MRLYVVNDLHQEFSPFVHNFPEADVAILAGDVSVGLKGIEWAKTVFDIPVIYVPGNHEYYGRRILREHDAAMKEAARGSNVYVLQRDTIFIDGVRFIGATLWTDFNLYGNAPLHMRAAAINDFAGQILSEPGLNFTPEQSQVEHQTARDYLITEMAKPHDGATVVVTHHAPSEQSIHPRYANMVLNTAFASRLENIILDGNPDLWVHGHVHDSFDYRIGNTCVLCNPRGYVIGNSRENATFDPNLVVTV